MALGSLFSNLFGSNKSKTPEGAPHSLSAALDKRITHRREQVEQAVTETMMDAGVVSSGYQHEVRAVDERAHQFMVSIDLPKELASIPAGSLAQIGATIARKARAMKAGEVMAVYWRVEHDAQAWNQEHLNLMAMASSRSVPPVPAAPVEAVVPPALSAAVTASQRIANLREMMKDDVPSARNAGKPAPVAPAQHPGAGADSQDEPDHGFANTVLGFDADDTPAKKR